MHIQIKINNAPLYLLACHSLLLTDALDGEKGSPLLKDFLTKGDWFPFSKPMTAQIHGMTYADVSALWQVWETAGVVQVRENNNRRERRLNPAWVAEVLFAEQANGLKLPPQLVQWCAEEIAEGVL